MMPESPKALGRMIKAVRSARGESGMAFAGRLGISLDTLRSWESGRSRPDAENLFKLADLAPPRLTWKLLAEVQLTPSRARAWLARTGRPRHVKRKRDRGLRKT